MERQRIKRVNWIFLLTLGMMILPSFLPLQNIIKNSLQNVLLSQSMIAIPGIIYLIISRQRYTEAVRLKKMGLSNIVLVILFAILISPVMTFVNALSMLYSTNVTTSTMTNITSSVPLLVSLLAIAVLPAVVEESMYRGVFYNEYRKVNPIGAIFLSAFLFGILHGNLNQFTYAFFMGIIFALMIEATDSILSTMILHFITNGTSVVILYVYPKLLSYFQTVYDNAVSSGDVNLAAQIESMLGTTTFDMNELMEEATTAVSATLGSVLVTYGMAALVGGILAFLVYRTIAKNTNRWDYVKNIFLHNRPDGEQEFHVEEGRKKRPSLITVPLACAILYLVVNMILAEMI